MSDYRGLVAGRFLPSSFSIRVNDCNICFYKLLRHLTFWVFLGIGEFFAKTSNFPISE